MLVKTSVKRISRAINFGSSFVSRNSNKISTWNKICLGTSRQIEDDDVRDVFYADLIILNVKFV